MRLVQVLIAVGCMEASATTPERQAAKIRAVAKDLRACIAEFRVWFRRDRRTPAPQ